MSLIIRVEKGPHIAAEGLLYAVYIYLFGCAPLRLQGIFTKLCSHFIYVPQTLIRALVI